MVGSIASELICDEPKPVLIELQLVPPSMVRDTPLEFVPAYMMLGVTGSIASTLTNKLSPVLIGVQLAPLSLLRR